jgi:outer membrane protein TolC
VILAYPFAVKDDRMSRRINQFPMAPWLQRVAPWCGALTIALGGLEMASGAAPTIGGYSFRGVEAPQVKPNPLAGELAQKLSALREQLKSRSLHTTLASAIEQSLLHNPELAQAYAQIQQSEWSLIAVRRQWYPSLTGRSIGPAGGLWGYSGGSIRSSNNTVTSRTDQSIYNNEDRFAAQLTLDWTFFDPSRGAQINAALKSLRSQELLFDVSARNLVLQTQLTYFSLQEQQQLIGAYEEILEATNAQVEQVEAAFNIGNASIADVEQIKTQQYQTITLLIKTHLGLIDAAAQLGATMALPPGQIALPTDRLESYGQWDLTLKASIEQAVALREEIQASLTQAESANWRASALFNRYWPRFNLGGFGTYVNSNRRSGTFGTSNPIMLESSSWDGALGVGFNWAIFDGGIAAAEAQANKALARQYDDQAAIQRLQVTRDVEQSYASYETSRLALLSSRQQARSAREATIAVRERFDVGYADMTSVVQTLNQMISAANAYSLSQREYNSAVASLYRATAQWPDKTQTLRDKRVEELKH